MHQHSLILQIHLKDAGGNRGKKDLLSLVRLHHIDVIGACLKHVCENAKSLFCIVKNLQINQICDKIFIFFKRSESGSCL